jgi:hypothetical protein
MLAQVARRGSTGEKKKDEASAGRKRERRREKQKYGKKVRREK